jgi:FkbM family methyltransferase
MPRRAGALPDAKLQGLVESASIGGVRAIDALKWLCRVAPLQHRLFPLLRTCLPDHGLITIPFAGGSILYPAAWVGPYNASHLFGIHQLFPERHLFEATLAAAPSGVVVDVGANLGVYTLMARSVTRAPIIAYEPSPLAFHVLKRMLEVNHLTGVELRLKACGDAPGRACLQEGINSYVGGAVAVAAPREFADFDHLCRQARDGFVGIDAEQATLDDELAAAGPIKLIKIDCEGFEHRILLGARRVLAEQRPTCFIELHPEMIQRTGDTSEGLCGLLRDAAYTVECWNFQRARRASRVTRLLSRYHAGEGHRYRDVDEMLADLPRSRPQQVYLVARPANGVEGRR